MGPISRARSSRMLHVRFLAVVAALLLLRGMPACHASGLSRGAALSLGKGAALRIGTLGGEFTGSLSEEEGRTSGRRRALKHLKRQGCIRSSKGCKSVPKSAAVGSRGRSKWKTGNTSRHFQQQEPKAPKGSRKKAPRQPPRHHTPGPRTPKPYPQDPGGGAAAVGQVGVAIVSGQIPLEKDSTFKRKKGKGGSKGTTGGTSGDSSSSGSSPPAQTSGAGTGDAGGQASGSSLQYHGGGVMIEPSSLYVVWYGTWSEEDKGVVRDFLSSFQPSSGKSSSTQGGRKGRVRAVSVMDWAATLQQYSNKSGAAPSCVFSLAGEASTTQTAALSVKSTERLLQAMIQPSGPLPLDPKGAYIILSSSQVGQDGFCSERCGYHAYVSFKSSHRIMGGPYAPSQSSRRHLQATRKASTSGLKVPYAWIGDPKDLCSGFCGFPYFAPEGESPSTATILKPPNGKPGLDALIGVLSHEIAEIVTSPFLDGWYSGLATAPMEVADVCTGTYGPLSYPGNPGTVPVYKDGTSYNVFGANGRRFLLPWLWSNKDNQCN